MVAMPLKIALYTCTALNVYKVRQGIKRQQHHFADKGRYSQSYGFSSSHVWM